MPSLEVTLLQYQPCCTSSNDERFTVPSGRSTHVEPHQDFPVTHLQLYSAVSHPSLVPLLAESRLGNLCQLMQEAYEQGDTGLIHLQPEQCRKSFALYYVWHLETQQAASLHGLLCSILWRPCSPHPVQSALGWRRMALSAREGCALTRQSLQHRTLHPSHSALCR